ncbi:MAG: ABC transporter ATP-binding protein [Spirochaetes bacterium]|uniref:ABC transporter ATP-binding protein n=1 Tax=Candidatus Ornithospirochaeta stercoripullorum TaxID=2840899 RepID=A0A9D9E109_9SPIO|nr:ABC transporter ATP-binding protein [Candidatus Ornithospirochaeta stercoripullorum]
MLLEASGLSFSYGKRKVLEHISFNLAAGTSTALLGRNGSGKTTLMRILLGFIRQDSGKIMIDSRDACDMSSKERASAIAYIPQSTSTVYSYSVLDAVMMGRAPSLTIFQRPGKKDEEKAEEVLEMLGIAQLKKRSINALSGGERQLVLIARALTQDAKILLLDEPTASLDYSNQLLVMETAEHLREKGYALLFSTHSPEQALMNATGIMILKDSELVFNGKPDALLDGNILQELYDRKLCIRKIDTGHAERIVCIPE